MALSHFELAVPNEFGSEPLSTIFDFLLFDSKCVNLLVSPCMILVTLVQPLQIERWTYLYNSLALAESEIPSTCESATVVATGAICAWF